MTEADIKALQGQEAFAKMVKYLHEQRESAIGGLYNAPDTRETDRACGEIRALDNLLLMVDYQKILKMWEHLV